MTIQNKLVYCPHCKSNRLGKALNSGPYVCAVCGCPDTEAPVDLRMHEETRRRHTLSAAVRRGGATGSGGAQGGQGNQSAGKLSAERGIIAP